MPLSSVIVSLPTADRRTSFAFYGEGLGFDAIGSVYEFLKVSIDTPPRSRRRS